MKLHRAHTVLVVSNPELCRIGCFPAVLQEDEELKRAVAVHGDKRWSQIASYLPGRTSKACSHRLVQ